MERNNLNGSILSYAPIREYVLERLRALFRIRLDGVPYLSPVWERANRLRNANPSVRAFRGSVVPVRDRIRFEMNRRALRIPRTESHPMKEQ